MVWKLKESRENKLIMLRADLEARGKKLLAQGLPKERHRNDPVMRHFTAEMRKIRRSLAAHAKAQQSPAERAEKSGKQKEGKPAKPGKKAKAPKAPKEPKAAKEPKAPKEPKASKEPEAAADTDTTETDT